MTFYSIRTHADLPYASKSQNGIVRKLELKDDLPLKLTVTSVLTVVTDFIMITFQQIRSFKMQFYTYA